MLFGALLLCSSQWAAPLWKRVDKDEILPRLESVPALLPLPDQNKREHIAARLGEESCCLFL